MNWENICITEIWHDCILQPPKEDGLYLCCGDTIEWNMKDEDPPDEYTLAFYKKGSWTPRVSPYEEIKLQLWCELPTLPTKYQMDKIMHKKIMQKAAKALSKDAKHYAKEAKHAKGVKKKHEKVEMKEAKSAAKDLKRRVKKAHEY